MLKTNNLLDNLLLVAVVAAVAPASAAAHHYVLAMLRRQGGASSGDRLQGFGVAAACQRILLILAGSGFVAFVVAMTSLTVSAVETFA